MKSYGFIEDGTNITEEATQEALLKYQKFFGLPKTGIVDAATKNMMKQPRCGLPDITPASYVLAPKQYFAKHLRWSLNQTHETVPEDYARRIISESVQTWLNWMDSLTLIQSDDPNSEILINFVRPDEFGRHGDGIPFADYELAHAFYPDNYAKSGDIHINMRKRFSLKEPPRSSEYSLKWLIMHEFGHVLGLGHSIHKSSVMHPVIRAGSPYPGLDHDDIYGIQEMYGECTTLKCKNGGTCVSLARNPGSICVCPAAYTGLYCEIGCSNKHPYDSDCDTWQRKGECIVNQKWMEEECFKSCSKCDIPKCVNLHPDDGECTEWAQNGECSTSFAKWMRTYCYKSCTKCDDQQSLSCP